MSEVEKEIWFVYNRIESLGIGVKLSIIVRTDNIDAICMIKSVSTGVCETYIDTRYHFIQEHVEDG